MAIKVYDFYSRDKVCVVKKGNFLLNNAEFYILVNKDGEIKELSVQVPKRYHFITLLNYGEYTASKKDEYDVLVDFIKYNKELLQNKWELSDLEYTELLEELEFCLISLHSKYNWLIKALLKVLVVLKYFARGLKG
jgi:hypothetical protein